MLPLIFVLGVTAGLRSMTPLAVVAWASHSWPGLQQSWLSFMAAPIAAYVLTALAVGELIADKLPFTPSRLQLVPLAGRIVSGALCGAVLCASRGQSDAIGAVVGAIGAVLGSFGGYSARHALTSPGRLADLPVALLEDVLAIGLAVFAASRV